MFEGFCLASIKTVSLSSSVDGGGGGRICNPRSSSFIKETMLLLMSADITSSNGSFAFHFQNFHFFHHHNIAHYQIPAEAELPSVNQLRKANFAKCVRVARKRRRHRHKARL
jgi:hypothetical protein